MILIECEALRDFTFISASVAQGEPLSQHTLLLPIQNQVLSSASLITGKNPSSDKRTHSGGTQLCRRVTVQAAATLVINMRQHSHSCGLSLVHSLMLRMT